MLTGRRDAGRSTAIRTIYAPGDAGDFPIKQAFLAFLQADTVAEHIVAEASGKPFATPFDPVSMCVMEMFDKATFAQVPLQLTGDAARPVEVRPDADGDVQGRDAPIPSLFTPVARTLASLTSETSTLLVHSRGPVSASTGPPSFLEGSGP